MTKIRRVVTGQDENGKSVFVSDEEVDATTLALLPGYEFHRMWASDPAPTLPTDGRAGSAPAYFPPPGGFRFGFFTVPPAGVDLPPDLDMNAALAEMEGKLPGMAAHMEPDNPGMHTTDTIDFEVVLSGEVICELDDGAEVTLKKGDTFVQNGTRHRWRNPGSVPAVLFVALLGAERPRVEVLSTDVVVVGGGPAGASAAITLARAGRDVVVVDRAQFPRDKSCGDGLTAEALRLLEALGLDPGVVPSWQTVDDVVVRSPSGRTTVFPLPRGHGLYAAVARRTDLDAALLDVARAAGAKVLDGHALTAAHQRHDRVVLAVDGLGEVHGRYAIGADGAWSPLRKALGAAIHGYLGEWHAFRQYFTGVGPDARQLWVWFEPDLLPGYAWSFPLPDGRANVGFGVQRADLHRAGRIDRVQAMKDVWPDLLARPHVRAVLGPDATPESPHRAWPIPARVDDVALTCGRALFAGDAACATDPLTGEGIAQALLTGVLAARAINGGGPVEAARVATDYERAVRAELFADHRMSRLLIRAVRHRRGACAAVRVAGATPWTRRSFGRWLFEGYPRALLATPRRWHRTMFTEPGAYETR